MKIPWLDQCLIPEALKNIKHLKNIIITPGFGKSKNMIVFNIPSEELGTSSTNYFSKPSYINVVLSAKCIF